MNEYEARQEARRQRYEKKAQELQAEALALHDRAREMASVIPFGQPILVGHHSEKRDRRYRQRIHDTFGKAFATQDKARHYAEKASTVGQGGISSDDPDALNKLRDKLDMLKKNHEQMKAANAAIRRGKTPELQMPALMALGYSEEQARELLLPNCFGIVGFAPYSLQNSNANIKRVEQRIRQLEQARQAETLEQEGNGYTYREDPEENRVMFIFDGKPEVEIRNVLKSNGFKWSPSRGAWVRMLNGNGRYAAGCVRQSLDAM